MKSSIVCAIIALACVFDAAAAKQLTPEQIERRRAARAARTAANGGIVTKPQSGNSVRVVSAQGAVDIELIKKCVKDISFETQMAVEVSEMAAGKCALEDVEKVMKTPKTGFALLLVEDAKLPLVLSAPENAWAIFNVKTLNEDMPPKEVYESRIRKELTRAFAFAFNAGQSFNPSGLMTPVYTKTDLDALRSTELDPEALAKIQTAAKMRGIQPTRKAIYRVAVMEGWAPKPTNDVQRAIWKEVHELPTNPLKIEFDPKTDKK